MYAALTDTLKDFISRTSADLLKYAILAVIVLAILAVLWRIVAGRKRKPVGRMPDLSVDVASLGTGGPPPGAPVLEFCSLPVRLAVVVLAPAGRVRELPALNQLSSVFDAIVPGLARVVATHKPVLRRWPAQLSTKGFAHNLFHQVRLPGEGGKGTPWSSAAGTVKLEGQPLLAGLVFCAGSPNDYGQQIIESEGDWLRILRVRG